MCRRGGEDPGGGDDVDVGVPEKKVAEGLDGDDEAGLAVGLAGAQAEPGGEGGVRGEIEMAEGGGRRAEGGGRRAEDGGRRTEGGGRRAEDGGRRAEGGGRRTEGGGRRAEGGGRRAEGGRRGRRGGLAETAVSRRVLLMVNRAVSCGLSVGTWARVGGPRQGSLREKDFRGAVTISPPISLDTGQ